MDQAASRVGGRQESGAPAQLSGESLAHDVVWGAGPVPSYTGLVGQGRKGVVPASSTNIVTSPTSNSLSR